MKKISLVLAANALVFLLPAKTIAKQKPQLIDRFVFKNCDEIPGGLQQLKDFLIVALNQGLSCMNGLGPERKKDAAKLTALIEPLRNKKHPHNSPLIACGGAEIYKGREEVSFLSDHVGVAANQDAEIFPALLLNTDKLSKYKKEEISGVLLHEMIHWLGYRHNHGLDVTYLTEFCCFPKSEVAKSKACSLLKDSPDWHSVGYASRFANLMRLEMIPQIALDSAWESVFQNKTNARPNSETESLLATAMEAGVRAPETTEKDWRATGIPVMAVIYAEASLGGLPHDVVYRQDYEQRLLNALYPESDSKLKKIRVFLQAVGGMGRAILAENTEEVKLARKEVDKLQSSGCSAMSANEKSYLYTATSQMTDRLAWLLPKFPETFLNDWKYLCFK